MPEPDPDDNTTQDANPKDAWFGYSRLEMNLKFIADSLTMFKNLYISANSGKDATEPEFVEYPSPYNDKGKPKHSFSKEEVQRAMEQQALAMEAVAGVVDWAALFAGEDEQSPEDEDAPPGESAEK